MKKKRKLNRAARAKIKAEKANEYNVSFSHGYQMGYEAAMKEHGIHPSESEIGNRKYNLD